MTSDQFFRKLRKVRKGFYVRANGSIRTHKFLTCPIVAVAGGTGCEHAQKAGRKLKLTGRMVDRLMMAADASPRIWQRNFTEPASASEC